MPLSDRHLLIIAIQWLTLVITGAVCADETIEMEDDFGEYMTFEEIEKRLNKLENRPLSSGYDRGFFIRSKDEQRDSSYELKINGWGQLRGTAWNLDNTTDDELNGELERARLIFHGHLISPDFNYFIQFDGDSDAGNVVDLLDFFIDWDVGHEFCCYREDELRIRVGQWKVPFNRARSLSGKSLAFADRSVASVFFDANRSVGLGVISESPEHGFDWSIALANGIRTGSFRPNRSAELDDYPAFLARVTSDLYGEWGRDEVSDLSFHECLAVRTGAGFAFSRVDSLGSREFIRYPTVDSGASLPNVLPAGTYRYDLTMYSIDMSAKYRGWSLFAEWYARTVSGVEPIDVPLFDHGFWLHTGYFWIPKKLETFARMSRIVGDSSTAGAVDQSFDEVAVGTAWYFDGENRKLVFDATHANGVPLRDSALNVRPGDDGWMYRLQFQFAF